MKGGYYIDIKVANKCLMKSNCVKEKIFMSDIYTFTYERIFSSLTEGKAMNVVEQFLL